MTLYRNFKKQLQEFSPKYYIILDRYKVIIKYLFSGGMAAIADLGLLYIFTDIVGFHYLFSASIAFIVAFFISFFMQKFWTFRDTGSDKRMYRQMVFYFLIGIANLGANAWGLYLLVGKLGMMYIVAQIIMGALLAVGSFTINRLFIFKKRRKLKKLEGVENKRILIVTGIFPPTIGGPATYSKTLLEELPSRGFDVKIVTYGLKNQNKNFKNENVYLIDNNKNIFLRYFCYFLKVWKFRNWAHLVYIQGPVSEGLPAFCACVLSGKKYILKVVGDYAWESYNRNSKTKNNDEFIDMLKFQDGKYDFKTQLLRKIETIVAKSAQVVVTPSVYLKEVVKRWGIEDEKIKVIYNSVKSANIQITKEEARKEFYLDGSIIFSSARLVPWKGMDTLIELMPDLLKLNPGFKLVINGQGPEFSNLEEKIKNLNLGGNVLLTGKLEQKKLWHYMRAADIFVLNTGYEGLPHIVIEAMSIGTPVITTRVGGNAEVVNDNSNGILVEYNNKDELKKTIVELWKDNELRNRLTTQAKRDLNRFSREVMVDRVEKLINDFI